MSNIEYTPVCETPDNLFVFLGIEPDDYPDVDWLGEFSDKIQERFYYDRKTGELRDSDVTITIEDEDGNTLESHLVVADMGSRGLARGAYEYIGAFQHGWELDDNSAQARQQFKKYVADGTFKAFGINPKRSKYRRTGYWLAVVCMCQDAKRLEDLNDGYWWMNVVRLEVRDVEDNVLATDIVGGIESDFDGDIVKEFLDLDGVLAEARKSLPDSHESRVAAGQLELF